MINTLKKFLYFPIAFYFAFWAKIRLFFWKPKIVVVTGSSGKTTLLHMIASQLGSIARYSYKANSSYGIPFDILGLKRINLSLIEWPMLFFSAPVSLFKPLPKQKIYVAEVDCDRPFEGVFLGRLLRPSIVLWLNTTKTHSVNFEKLAKRKNLSLLKVITKEFGNIARYTKDLLIYNKDMTNLEEVVSEIEVDEVPISLGDHKLSFEPNLVGTTFVIDGDKYTFKCLLPKSSFYQMLMCLELVRSLGVEGSGFSAFKLPAGRSSVFKGIKATTLIDSTYNANLDSMRVILELFDNLKAENKWIVLGDMLEQGKSEQAEHEKLVSIIKKYDFDRIILMGPRVEKYVKPKLKKDVVSFDRPDDVLSYLTKNLEGGEVILFKGARFLEGVIEALLQDKTNAKNLVRREKVWQKRRKKFGL